MLSFIDIFGWIQNLQNDIQSKKEKKNRKKRQTFLISKLHKYFLNLGILIQINHLYLRLVTNNLQKVFGVSIQKEEEKNDVL